MPIEPVEYGDLPDGSWFLTQNRGLGTQLWFKVTHEVDVLHVHGSGTIAPDNEREVGAFNGECIFYPLTAAQADALRMIARHSGSADQWERLANRQVT